jgi:Acetyltransferase (GNAT) domain
MKILLQQPKPDFDSYVARPETIFCQRESGDSIEGLYAQGYLPYSGTIGLSDVWYSARSARVLVPEFSLTSENRRIAKKFDEHFEKERIPIAQFSHTQELIDLFTEYSVTRHTPNTLPAERMRIILSSPCTSTIVRYSAGDVVEGYAIEAEDGATGEFWQSAYAPALIKQSLGLWLMLDCIRDAQARGLAYYYLGTVYGPKALYKTNFEPLEWWDGAAWSRDIGALKALSRSENK